MFRIRRIHDDVGPANIEAVAQVERILKDQFPGLSAGSITKVRGQLRNPVRHGFRSILFVAEDQAGHVSGFALLSNEPDLHFGYVDYIATTKRMTSRGVGGALYSRVREEARALDARGLFFECLPDDPKLTANPEIRRQNVARLRFYERFGARPIANTAYETPLIPGTGGAPYLVFDGLGRDEDLPLDRARTIVRAILERKYGDRCPPGYIDMVVDSFRDDPVLIRPPRYLTGRASLPVETSVPDDERILLVVNDRHTIHHVRQRGYVEAPVRITTIKNELDRTGLFHEVSPHRFPDRHILAVHDTEMIEYMRRMCETLEPGKSVYPYVFPIRNSARPPKEMAVRAGYYCIDTFTPLNRNAFPAARRAVDCALTAAEAIVEGWQMAYALVRPPGHHAERNVFGGFCYMNAGAIAAQYLSSSGRVAILDVDYHHGNGQQDIFYRRSDVLTASIHGHPRFAYPYFSGFEDEKGIGSGVGYNWNMPLSEALDGERYREALDMALKRIRRFRPQYLVVSLGLDTARADPTGTWDLRAADFEANGRMIGALGLPTLVVQEGGYNNRNLGINARHFFVGLWLGAQSAQGRGVSHLAYEKTVTRNRTP